MNPRDAVAAIELINHGQLNEALNACLVVFQADPADHYALFLIGHIHAQVHDFTNAEQHLANALAMAEEPLYFSSLAEILRKSGKYRDWLALLGRAVSRHPDDLGLREALEDALCQSSLRDEVLTLSPPGDAAPHGTVSFETKVWEADWKVILESGRLEAMIEQCDYPFAERTLVINNVEDRGAVVRRAEQLVASGVLTRYLDVAEEAGEALRHFELSREDLGKGYVYSIAELVSAYRLTTDYLVHFAGDSMMGARHDWISPAIRAFSAHPRFAVANPTWSAGEPDERGAREESFAEYGEFLVGFGFSDQCYLMRAEDLRADIYRFDHPAGKRYPAYGGELFEKRVDAWMRTLRRPRLTHKGAYYIHRNIR